MIASVILAAALAQGPSMSDARGNAPSPPFPTGKTQTVNIVKWDANQLPKIYERSDQLPLTDEEVTKLSKEGFDPPDLVKMIEERRCACDASADGLVKLKRAGVHKDVIRAISLHGLRPNRSLYLDVMLDFVGESTTAREAFLYFFVDDGGVTRVFMANLAELLGTRRAHEEMVDKSDILLARTVRRIRLPGEVALKTYGKHQVLVAASASPTLTHPSQLNDNEMKNAQSFTFEYPRVSLLNVCRLNAGYKRDAVLAYKWNFVGSHFECEWN
ncbi:MAG: hypothetical protein ACT4TC_26595 [Myxococcaceae bacterium]